tara:strand:- start:771 stop:1634 length:864 start_codon:yes stop_codon:yes gene_type:complete
MCLGLGLLGGAGAGAGAAAGAATGFGAAATAGSALGFGAGASTFLAAAPAISFAAPAAAGIGFGAAATAGSALGFGSLGAGLLASAPAVSFAAPALTGATGLFGLGSATNSFLFGQALNLGTNIFSTISQRNQIFRQVQGIYDSSLQLIANAEKAKADQERAINQLLDDKLKSKKQEILTVKVKTLKAKEALIASERAGITIGLLAQDFENQGANATESILQESDTLVSQALRDKNAVIATRDTRRNAAKDQITKATNLANSAPTLLGAITKTLGSGLSSYASLVAA